MMELAALRELLYSATERSGTMCATVQRLDLEAPGIEPPVRQDRCPPRVALMLAVGKRTKSPPAVRKAPGAGSKRQATASRRAIEHRCG